MSAGNQKRTRKDNWAFVPAILDDAGLDPIQFRIFCHIARRGHCYSSIRTIADVCGLLDVRTVRKALRTLTAHKMIKAERKPGATTTYSVTPIAEWIDLPLTSNVSTPLTSNARGTPDIECPPKVIPSEGDPKKVTEIGSGEAATSCETPVGKITATTVASTPDRDPDWNVAGSPEDSGEQPLPDVKPQLETYGCQPFEIPTIEKIENFANRMGFSEPVVESFIGDLERNGWELMPNGEPMRYWTLTLLGRARKFEADLESRIVAV